MGEKMNLASNAFIILGVEYYIAARFALENHLSAIAGNLFHHSIECLLKGFLVNYHSLKELKNPDIFGHNLIALWNEFLKISKQDELPYLRECVIHLNRFEGIRYPVGEGGFDGVGIYISYFEDLEGFLTTSFPDAMKNEKDYLLLIARIDEVVEKTFLIGNWDVDKYFKEHFHTTRKLSHQIRFNKKEWYGE